MKPKYYEALWHNCSKCHIHYMSEQPHLRAYLCDECWNSMPHYKVDKVISQKPQRGPTFLWLEGDFSWKYIVLYTLGCMMWLWVIGYYLWFK